MNRRTIWGCLGLACCLLVCSAQLVFGAEEGEEPIQLEAAELVYDQDSGTYLAEREVVLRQGEKELQAERNRRQQLKYKSVEKDW